MSFLLLACCWCSPERIPEIQILRITAKEAPVRDGSVSWACTRGQSPLRKLVRPKHHLHHAELPMSFLLLACYRIPKDSSCPPPTGYSFVAVAQLSKAPLKWRWLSRASHILLLVCSVFPLSLKNKAPSLGLASDVVLNLKPAILILYSLLLGFSKELYYLNT